ncbi:MAG: MFS transporter, partial [Loktanella sp.]|nr:MFS transporter [Loktanella sp.]
YLDREDMAAASGGLLFINGVGAILGPIAVGYTLDAFGTAGYWTFCSTLMLLVAAYGIWRMTRRSRADLDFEPVDYAPISGSSTPVLAGVAQEFYIDAEEEAASDN